LKWLLGVACSKCKAPVARVKNQRSLKRLSTQRIACHSCGGPIDGKTFVEVFEVTSLTGELLDKSYWMSLYVRNLLIANGISPGWILVEIQHGPNELDVVVNSDGQLILMELKDSRFSMGSAYSFVGKCSQYKPARSVIIAADGVDGDVKEYLQNAGISPLLVEGLDNVEISLREFFRKIVTEQFVTLWSKISWDFALTHLFVSRHNLLDITLLPKPTTNRSYV
jgi:hypothetical protein